MSSPFGRFMNCVGDDDDESELRMSAVVTARPKSFSRGGGGLAEGGTGEDGDGLVVI
jgi:hypothetical protein